ncbi:MAG: hypothetical protein V4582_02990 [Pseudomonadota bacterium]
MRRLKLKVAASLLLAGVSVCGGLSHAGTADGMEAQLAGAWQEGLVQKVRSMSPIQQQMYVGNVMVFNVDHHFLMYPKCGPEAAAYKAKNLVAVSGEWSISGDGVLHLIVQQAGKRADQAIPVTVDGDEMVFGKGAPKPSVFGKYEGPLPPQCPSK